MIAITNTTEVVNYTIEFFLHRVVELAGDPAIHLVGAFDVWFFV